MTPAVFQPARGDFVWLDFTPQAGHEQAGTRAALVLSKLEFNVATGLAVVCPITNTASRSRLSVPIPRGVQLTGFILSHQFLTLDWIARKARFHSRAHDDLMGEVLGRIEAILGIDS